MKSRRKNDGTKKKKKRKKDGLQYIKFGIWEKDTWHDQLQEDFEIEEYQDCLGGKIFLKQMGDDFSRNPLRHDEWHFGYKGYNKLNVPGESGGYQRDLSRGRRANSNRSSNYLN